MNYRTQLELLRERFLRVDSKDKFQNACVKGGLIVKEYFSVGGIIGSPELTKFFSDYLNAADDTDDSLLADFRLRSGFQFLANWASDDPNILELKVFSRADGITLLNSKPGSHEERSERFAAFCLELLDMLESQSIDIIALVNKLFAECKGSQQAKGKEMAVKLTDEQWEAYKKARTGRPITTTREQHFTQRYKNANKPNATKKAKATKKPK